MDNRRFDFCCRDQGRLTSSVGGLVSSSSSAMIHFTCTGRMQCGVKSPRQAHCILSQPRNSPKPAAEGKCRTCAAANPARFLESNSHAMPMPAALQDPGAGLLACVWCRVNLCRPVSLQAKLESQHTSTTSPSVTGAGMVGRASGATSWGSACCWGSSTRCLLATGSSVWATGWAAGCGGAACTGLTDCIWG